jgi:putative resolvase
MGNMLTISETAQALGVSMKTLRRWDRDGLLKPTEVTPGGHRRYDLTKIQTMRFRPVGQPDRKTVAYARVSSKDQQTDLERQIHLLELYCASQGWTYEVISDLGSGMNYQKKGLKRLLEGIINGEVQRLVITHKDRLLRFGAELVFAICEARECEVVIINQGKDSSFEEDLAKDVLEIIEVFGARLYGSRSHKAKQMIESITEAVSNP